MGEGVRVKNRNFTCKYPKSRRGSGLLHLKLRVIDSTADSRHLETRNSRCKNPNPVLIDFRFLHLKLLFTKNRQLFDKTAKITQINYQL